MTLKEIITIDFMTAFKVGDKAAKMTLGMLKAAITEAEKHESNKGRELTDVDYLAVVQSYDKKLDQTINAMVNAGKGDMQAAVETLAEKKIIAKYLPTQMTDEAIRTEVGRLFESISDKSNKNKVVGTIMGEFKKVFNGTYNAGKLKIIVDQLINA